LAQLHAEEAVPLLLEHLEDPDVIGALERIGDGRALPSLRILVADKGAVVRDGKPIEPDVAGKRLFAARLAVMTLEARDAVPQLCEMVADQSLDEFQRREAVWRLTDRRDLRAVPHLIRAIKVDDSGVVVNQSITVLQVFKSKAAVEGLIECFDVNFEGKQDWKRAYTPEMFRDHIADSLCEITGQSIGPDKQAWLSWWREKGKDLTDLK
jgi:HEAT repeat protein